MRACGENRRSGRHINYRYLFFRHVDPPSNSSFSEELPGAFSFSKHEFLRIYVNATVCKQLRIATDKGCNFETMFECTYMSRPGCFLPFSCYWGEKLRYWAIVRLPGTPWKKAAESTPIIEPSFSN